MLKKLTEKVAQKVAEFSFFVGTYIADGFHARLDQIDEEERSMDWEQEQSDKKNSHGSN